jgi:DNA-binding transcriptional MerR regulator
VQREFFTEADLDELGLFTKQTRRRLQKKGLLSPPIQFGPNGQRLYTAEQIAQIKALAKPATATAA